jgi:4-hydroxybenzoate polyprenyltransferase
MVDKELVPHQQVSCPSPTPSDATTATQLHHPDDLWQVMIMTLAYSIAGLGIAIVNDFKSIEGDKALGLKSLPVEYGVDTAKWICVSTIDGFQLLIAAYLWAIDSKGYAAVLLLLIMPQVSALRSN